jgi:FtsZ-binding cell division protein ZapB
MLKKIVLTLVILTGCTQSPEVKIETNQTDSLLIKSKETLIISDEVSRKSDSAVNKKVKTVISDIKSIEQEISSLKEENGALAKAISLKTEKIIRDTVYITEKKNFWGKTKKTVDSSQSVQIDTLENNN